MTIRILTGVFIASFIIQLVYYLMVYIRIIFHHRTPEKKENFAPLSVIISAGNEAENLQNFLPLVLNQDYPDFEILVINDNSKDETAKVLSEFSSRYDNLTVLDAEKNTSGSGNKKRALTKAILRARNDLLVFTDADCYPVSNLWLKKIASAYSNDTEIVIAYGAYEYRKGFLNKMIRFETFFNAVQYLSFADLGFPYMAVGRNLSYKKSVFLKTNGFESHKNILSGDDDLFINEAADRKNTKIITDFESKTISIPKHSFKAYLMQKRRHLSAGLKYRIRNKFIIGTEITTRFFFYLIFLILLFDGTNTEAVILLFFVRIIVSVSVIQLIAMKMKEPINLFFISIFDILIPMLNLVIIAGTVFDKKNIWK